MMGKQSGQLQMVILDIDSMMTMSRFFRKSKIQPFGIRQSTGYDIRQQIILCFKKMIHIHITSGSPAGE